MSVLLKVIKEGNTTLVNVCEKELLGKVFVERGIVLHVNEEFYGGEEVSEDEAFALFDSASVVSLIGNRIVDEAISRGFVLRDSTIKVAGVTFAQIYNV
jgi:hypothetical protein